MAVVLRFAPEGMTAELYDECIERLEKAGAGSPEGRLYHVCFGDKSNIRVSDIWESVEAFERFGQTLRPILQELGVNAGEPEILEVHNVIVGSKTLAAER
jgi:hypothetical protein